jgi:hypothetical protein
LNRNRDTQEAPEPSDLAGAESSKPEEKAVPVAA